MVNANTDVYCILGNPVRHSFSPAMHNTAFKKLGLNAVYVAYEVNDIESSVNGIRSLGIKGASVTIPHKINVIPYLDEIEKIAENIGSVNTIINRDGKLIGTNTDAYGFYRTLSEQTDINDKTIAVFGAGGVARAACFACFHYAKPSKLILFTLENEMTVSRKLADNIIDKQDLEINQIECKSLSEWKNHRDDIDIIVNATPLGMSPHENSSILSVDDIPENKTVMDVVYHPNETLFIKNAKQNNCKIAYGINMLLYQGIQQFELWTQTKAPVKEMKEILLKHLNKK